MVHLFKPVKLNPWIYYHQTEKNWHHKCNYGLITHFIMVLFFAGVCGSVVHCVVWSENLSLSCLQYISLGQSDWVMYCTQKLTCGTLRHGSIPPVSWITNYGTELLEVNENNFQKWFKLRINELMIMVLLSFSVGEPGKCVPSNCNYWTM